MKSFWSFRCSNIYSLILRASHKIRSTFSIFDIFFSGISQLKTWIRMKKIISKSSYRLNFIFLTALHDEYNKVPIKYPISPSFTWNVLPESFPTYKYEVENWKSIKVTSKNLWSLTVWQSTIRFSGFKSPCTNPFSWSF